MMKLTSIAIILSILYIIILTIDHKTNDKHLYGFWKAHSDFCYEAGYDDMIFYIDNNLNEVHLIIYKNGNIVEDTRFIMNLSLTYDINNYIPLNHLYGSQYNQYYLELIDPDNESHWANKIFTMNYSSVHNSIVLTLDDIIYTELYKDPINTNILYKYIQE